MKIVTEYPPNWEEVKIAFPAENAPVIFCYGDTIYNPRNLPLRDDLIAHEQVHAKQQKKKGGPEKWWRKYIDDPMFRVGVEAEAYGQQVKFIKATKGDIASVRAMMSFAKYLSDPVYGNCIDEADAFKRISNVVHRP